MRISDWSSDVCSTDLIANKAAGSFGYPIQCPNDQFVHLLLPLLQISICRPFGATGLHVPANQRPTRTGGGCSERFSRCPASLRSPRLRYRSVTRRRTRTDWHVKWCPAQKSTEDRAVGNEWVST